MEKDKNIDSYINKIKFGLDNLELFMKSSYDKKNDENISPEEKINIIHKQLEVIDKSYNHAVIYRENFLNSIYGELKIQWEKEHIKKEIKLHLISNVHDKQISKREDFFNLLGQKNKKDIRELNLYIESFILALSELLNILELQENILKKDNIVGNENLEKSEIGNYINKFKNKINKIFIPFQRKVLGTFSENLMKEEKIFGGFLKNLKVKDIGENIDFENFIRYNGNVTNGIKLGVGLNILPESIGITETFSVVAYSYAYLNYLLIKNSKYNKEIFYKY